MPVIRLTLTGWGDLATVYPLIQTVEQTVEQIVPIDQTREWVNLLLLLVLIRPVGPKLGIKRTSPAPPNQSNTL